MSTITTAAREYASRIPDPPVADPLDTAVSYGLQLLAFVVRERVTVTLSDAQLALAIHVAPIASAVQVQTVRTPEGTVIRTVDLRQQVADAVAEAVRDLSLAQRLRARAR